MIEDMKMVISDLDKKAEDLEIKMEEISTTLSALVKSNEERNKEYDILVCIHIYIFYRYYNMVNSFIKIINLKAPKLYK